jgi:DNA transposition AAA+ family ATPase
MTSEGYDPTHFLMIRTYLHFVELCDTCRAGHDIGICHDRAGIGKTWSGLHYSQRLLIQAAARYPSAPQSLPQAIAQCRVLFYTPLVANTPQGVDKDIALLRRRLNALVSETNAAGTPARTYSTLWEPPVEYVELIIVDEANRLRQASLEHLRDLYDRDERGFGLVLMGMPGLEHVVRRYPQLYSRIGFDFQFEELSADEARSIIRAKWDLLRKQDFEEITDEAVVATIIRLTRSDFREITKFLKQARRILQNNGLIAITKDVIDLAAKGLLRGSE